MASIEVFYGKLKGETCEFSYYETTEAGHNIINASCDGIAHDDLRNAFKQLVPHLAFMCDEVEDGKYLEKAMDDISMIAFDSKIGEKLNKFDVTSFKLSGSGASESVVITGRKKLKSGKSVYLNTPAIKWEDEYQYINELRKAVETCKSEIVQYQDGKTAPDLQGDLFGDFDKQEEVQEA